MRSLRSVYIQQQVLELNDYLQHGILGAIRAPPHHVRTPSQQLHEPVHIPSQLPFHALDILIATPIIEIPRTDTSRARFLFYLGELRITNRMTRAVDVLAGCNIQNHDTRMNTIDIGITAMRLVADVDGHARVYTTVLDEINTRVTLLRPIVMQQWQHNNST